MKKQIYVLWFILLIAVIQLLVACAPAVTVNQVKLQSTVTVAPSFQAQTSPIAQPTLYRCGAWSSNNAPGGYSTIAVYARLTRQVKPVAGAVARATVHFQGGDATLDQQPTSDAGGYVSFTFPLMGRQPGGVPTTVDVTFTFGKTKIDCAPAFFTPQ
jgi:hypothetical protein